MIIRIPDDATNGDVLRLLFPSENFEDKGYICQYPLDRMFHDFSSKWWNSSYKGDRIMTNLEAKEKLYMEWQKLLENDLDYAGISEAYKMAFKALELESLTDTEQRIFLAAMGREEKICREVCEDGDGVDLVRVCREIERKVKKALWE